LLGRGYGVTWKGVWSPARGEDILEHGYFCRGSIIMDVIFRRIGAGRLGAGIWLLSQCSVILPSFYADTTYYNKKRRKSWCNIHISLSNRIVVSESSTLPDESRLT